MSHQTVEEIHSYHSKPFDIIVERESFGKYKMTVVNNNTHEAVETIEELHKESLSSTRETLKYKWLLNLGQ